ncbi:MAG: sugar ABC transporter ATP-binding protein [Gaiellaceae bacterium]
MADFRLQARGIRKSFGGVEVLHGVDLDAAGGTVLALLGENGAGKSTLVKILAGDYTADAGEIDVGGELHAGLTPVTARQLGIRMIFQELSDAPALTVAENISLGRWPGRRGVVNWRTLRRRAERALEQLGVDIDPMRPVSSLRIGERQVVEIARALSDEARCLILDEPTAALSSQEVDRLFTFVHRLRERGVSLIYITHRLDEVRQIADRVQVLRDGNVVLVGDVADLGRRELVSAMVGRAIEDVQRPPAPTWATGETPVLRFEGASSEGAFADVDLDVHPGEVVALYGKVGSGTGEIAEAAFGTLSLTGGTLELDGKRVAFRGPAQAIAAGVGLLPADRQREGVFAVRPVAENLSAPSWRRLAKAFGFITGGIEAAAYRRWHDTLGIRSRNDPAQPIGTLSGGNQQKVLLGRWLERQSHALLLVEPTRGVDVGARQEIYRSIRALSAQGVGILIPTSDYEEVVQVADRAAVMARGRIVAWFAGDEITTEVLTEAAGG